MYGTVRNFFFSNHLVNSPAMHLEATRCISRLQRTKTHNHKQIALCTPFTAPTLSPSPPAVISQETVNEPGKYPLIKDKTAFWLRKIKNSRPESTDDVLSQWTHLIPRCILMYIKCLNPGYQTFHGCFEWVHPVFTVPSRRKHCIELIFNFIRREKIKGNQLFHPTDRFFSFPFKGVQITEPRQNLQRFAF